jgi:hypothetical protein
MKRLFRHAFIATLFLPCFCSAEGVTAEVTGAGWQVVNGARPFDTRSVWSPYVIVRVKNESDKPIESISLHAHFIDGEGIEKDDEKEYISELAGKRTKEVTIWSSYREGPVVFVLMNEDSDKWKIDLEIQQSSSGVRKTLVSGRVLGIPPVWK